MIWKKFNFRRFYYGNYRFNKRKFSGGGYKIRLVDFWAVWCGPCQMMAPILHELETEMPDVQIGKVNVDEQMDLARQFRVVSIPTLIIFKNGQEVQRMVGVTSKEELKDALK